MNDPVTNGVIAERLGVHRQTVRFWRNREASFPPPTGRIAGAEVWEWEVVLSWCVTHSTSAVAKAGAQAWMEAQA